jgi:large subunit ribosomal protein L54
MICQRCQSNLLSRLHLQYVSIYPSLLQPLPVLSPNLRRYSSLPSKTMTPPSPQSGLQSISIPSAIASFPPEAPQISQPINTPAPLQSSVDSEDPTNAVVKRDSSSCFAGTRLLGLNYMKNKPDVVALEDSDYPHWLWGLLDGSEKQSNSVSGGVDISSRHTSFPRKPMRGSNYFCPQK